MTPRQKSIHALLGVAAFRTRSVAVYIENMRDAVSRADWESYAAAAHAGGVDEEIARAAIAEVTRLFNEGADELGLTPEGATIQ
jgi:hypothetical protein